jgi:hypothetical protein
VLAPDGCGDYDLPDRSLDDAKRTYAAAKAKLDRRNGSGDE